MYTQKGDLVYKEHDNIKENVGNVNSIYKVEEELKITCKWQRFDFKEGKYIDDDKNKTKIRINDTEYTPLNGKIEIAKEKELEIR